MRGEGGGALGPWGQGGGAWAGGKGSGFGVLYARYLRRRRGVGEEEKGGMGFKS